VTKGRSQSVYEMMPCVMAFGFEGSHDIEVKTGMAVGDPAEQIIRRAEADGMDLIILGRPGRSMISRMMLGSVSERALRYAHCPVMVVP
jgi:nucleotide-binding universal stress UspA family protein